MLAPRRRARSASSSNRCSRSACAASATCIPSGATAHWHGENAVGAEEHKVEELDNVEPWNIHIQQVMRAPWGDRVGLGVLEQLAFGGAPPERPHRHPRRLPTLTVPHRMVDWGPDGMPQAPMSELGIGTARSSNSDM